MHPTSREHGRCGDHARPHSGAEINPHPLLDLRVPTVGVEPIEVKAEPLRPLPQMRILEPRRIGEEQVVHLPEPSLAACRLGRAGGRPGPRMTRADGKVSEHEPARDVLQPEAERGAIRTLEVAVFDDERRIGSTPNVVGRTGLGNRRRAEARQVAARPSKIRLAPGSSLGEGA